MGMICFTSTLRLTVFMNQFDGLYLLLRVERKSLKEKVEDSCSRWAQNGRRIRRRPPGSRSRFRNWAREIAVHRLRRDVWISIGRWVHDLDWGRPQLTLIPFFLTSSVASLRSDKKMTPALVAGLKTGSRDEENFFTYRIPFLFGHLPTDQASLTICLPWSMGLEVNWA